MIGLQWRRWDLHIHSPSSLFNNQFDGATEDEKWEKYIATLESIGDIPVFGITDYFSVDGYRKVLEFKNSDRLQNLELILPNVEIRLDKKTDAGKAINFHFIFSPEIALELQERFFSHLKYTYDGRDYLCTRISLIDLGRNFKGDDTLDEHAAMIEGANQFKADLTNLREIFDKDKELGLHTLRGVPNSNRDGNSAIKDDSFEGSREEIYRFSHFIFSSNPNDVEYFLGRGTDSPDAVIARCGSLKPCIHGSDAHTNAKIGRSDQNRFCYIKSDLTFEGLKQIACEPAVRVRIAEQPPQLNPIRIQEIKLKFPDNTQYRGQKFCLSGERILSLNPGLNCVIGGRGSGKSSLLYLINCAVNPETASHFSESDQRLLTDGGTSIEPQTYVEVNGGAKVAGVEFFSQNEIEALARDHKRFTEVIYTRLLKLDDAGDMRKYERDILYGIGDIFEKFTSSLEADVLTKNLETKLNELAAAREVIKCFESEEYTRLHTEISTLSRELAIIEGTKRDYDELLVALEKIAESHAENQESESKVINPSNDYQSEISSIKSAVRNIIAEAKHHDFSEIETKRKQAPSEIDNAKKALSAYLSKSGLSEASLTDIASANVRIEGITADISELEAKILKLTNRAASIQVSSTREASDSYANAVAAQIESVQKILAAHKVSNLVKSIELRFSLDVDGIKEGIYKDFLLFFNTQVEAFISKSSFQRSYLKDLLFLVDPLKESTREEMCAAITSFQTTSNARPFLLSFFQSSRNFELYTLIRLRRVLNVVENRVISVIYDNRPITEASFGQRCTATLLLIILLGSNPIIIDEPEAHLDSLLIANYLVSLIKDKKEWRQIIFATHNANFVINGDSDLILALRTDEEGHTSILPTTIENPETRDDLLALEGGIQAFRLRDSRYTSISQ